jgi:hypothetical protein
MEFLRLVWGQEDECEEETNAKLPGLGAKAPLCLERIGTVLSLLDRLGSCWYGCNGGDHLIEYLCGRAESTARAGLRLMRFGFYDEALAAARGLGELGNLLFLFSLDEAVLADWKQVSRRERLQRYTPLQVRLAIEQRNIQPPINQERYSLLSERAAHVQPATRPQAHNLLGVSNAGGVYQEAGLLVSLNELALPLAVAAAFGACLLPVAREIRQSVVNASRSLVEVVGGATIDSIDEHYRQVLADPEAAAYYQQVADALRGIQRAR